MMQQDYTVIVEIARAINKHKTSVQRAAKREAWQFYDEAVRGGYEKRFPLNTLPKNVSLAVHRIRQQDQTLPVPAENTPTPATPAVIAPSAPLVLNDRERQKALYKADILRLYTNAIESAPWGKRIEARDNFVTAYNSGLAWPHLFKQLGPLKWKTLDSWSVKIRKNNNDCFHLADRRGRHLRGLCTLTDQQTDIFLRCVLRPNKPRIAESVRVAKAVMNQKGIEDGQSEATYRRWLQHWRQHNYHTWVFVREGAKAWNDQCAYYIERDLDVLNVGDVIVADGHNLNFEIINPWTGKRQNHMTLILFYDMRSSMPLGWEIMPTENTAAISSALRRAVIALGKYPRVVYLDNGRAFKARFFKGSPDFDEAGYAGLYQRMGAQTIHAWPYHGQSKTVERFFGTFAELERLNALSYTGTSIENKPPRMMRGEKMHRKLHEKQFGDRCLTMAEAHRIIAAWFDSYAGRKQQNGHLQGQRPIDVFMEGKGPGVDKAELTWLMMSLEIKHIHRNGITFQGRNYYHPALYGRRHPVTVRYDLQDTGSLWVFDQGGDLICEATPNDQVHPAAAQLGTEKDKELLREHIEYKRHQEKEVSSVARTLLANEILPEHERQMRMIGLSDQATIPQGKKPAGIVHLDQEKIAREVAEMQARQKEAEDRDFRDSLQNLDESDRYERLVELTAQGVELGPEWTGFMAFYEQTPEYERFAEYWENCRMKYGLMYRSVAQSA